MSLKMLISFDFVRNINEKLLKQVAINTENNSITDEMKSVTFFLDD